MLTMKQATSITGGGLGYPSKMPGTSYGLPAKACLIGAKLATVPGSVCHGCYAFKGNYLYPSVATSQAARLASIADPRWTVAMITLLEEARLNGRHGPKGQLRKPRRSDRTSYHRWHDSGDLQSVAHLAKIAAVASATPKIRHWLSTRELAIVLAYKSAGGTIPPNLVIRVSATMVDGPATSQWPTTSGVHSGERPSSGRACPAPQQGNECGTCRACWSANVEHVSYHKH